MTILSLDTGYCAICSRTTCDNLVQVPDLTDSAAVRFVLREKGWIIVDDYDGPRAAYFCCPEHMRQSKNVDAQEALNELHREIVKQVGKQKPRKPDMVHHPSHYGGADNPYEAIKVIDAWQLGFALGNTVKYVARAAHKGSELEDLKKAAWYLNHRIKQLEALSGGLVSLSGGPIYTKVTVHFIDHSAVFGLGRTRMSACNQWVSDWSENIGDVTCEVCRKRAFQPVSK